MRAVPVQALWPSVSLLARFPTSAAWWHCCTVQLFSAPIRTCRNETETPFENFILFLFFCRVKQRFATLEVLFQKEGLLSLQTRRQLP